MITPIASVHREKKKAFNLIHMFHSTDTQENTSFKNAIHS